MESEIRVPDDQEKTPTEVTSDGGAEVPSKDAKPPTVIRKALTGESFVEKVALLLLTASLSGLIVPIVIGSLQETQARNEAILQAQSKLLNDVSETIITYETLILDITWFKTKAVLNEEMHQKAFAKYSDRVVDLIATWRAHSARARTLVSPTISARIDYFLSKALDEQDMPINTLYRNKADPELWEKQHQRNREMLEEANNLITEITNDMKLSQKYLY